MSEKYQVTKKSKVEEKAPKIEHSPFINACKDKLGNFEIKKRSDADRNIFYTNNSNSNNNKNIHSREDSMEIEETPNHSSTRKEKENGEKQSFPTRVDTVFGMNCIDVNEEIEEYKKNIKTNNLVVDNEEYVTFQPLVDINQVNSSAENIMSKIKGVLSKNPYKNFVNEKQLFIFWKEISRKIALRLGYKHVESIKFEFFESVIEQKTIDFLLETQIGKLISAFILSTPCKWKYFEGTYRGDKKVLCSFTGNEISKAEPVYGILFESDESGFKDGPFPSSSSKTENDSNEKKKREETRQILLKQQFLIKRDENDIYLNIIGNILNAINPTLLVDDCVEKIVKDKDKLNLDDLKKFVKGIKSSKEVMNSFIRFVRMITLVKKVVSDVKNN